MTSETGPADRARPPSRSSTSMSRRPRPRSSSSSPPSTRSCSRRAAEYADQLVAVDPDDQDARVTSIDAVEGMGRDLQRRAASKSRMLQAPLKDLASETEEGGPVAKSLADLRIEVEKLDPTSLNLEPGWLNSDAGHDPRRGYATAALLHEVRDVAGRHRRHHPLARKRARSAQARQRHAQRRPEEHA